MMYYNNFDTLQNDKQKPGSYDVQKSGIPVTHENFICLWVIDRRNYYLKTAVGDTTSQSGRLQ